MRCARKMQRWRFSVVDSMFLCPIFVHHRRLPRCRSAPRQRSCDGPSNRTATTNQEKIRTAAAAAGVSMMMRNRPRKKKRPTYQASSITTTAGEGCGGGDSCRNKTSFFKNQQHTKRNSGGKLRQHTHTPSRSSWRVIIRVRVRPSEARVKQAITEIWYFFSFCCPQK